MFVLLESPKKLYRRVQVWSISDNVMYVFCSPKYVNTLSCKYLKIYINIFVFMEIERKESLLYSQRTFFKGIFLKKIFGYMFPGIYLEIFRFKFRGWKVNVYLWNELKAGPF